MNSELDRLEALLSLLEQSSLSAHSIELGPDTVKISGLRPTNGLVGGSEMKFNPRKEPKNLLFASGVVPPHRRKK